MSSVSEVDAVDAKDVFNDPQVAPLAEAIAAGDRARVRDLADSVDLSSCGDKRVTLLQWALLNQNLDGLNALLDAGADPSQPGMDGDTVVHYAAKANDAAYLRALLAHGVDPDVVNANSGASPLHGALKGERLEQFRALLAAGADPDLADCSGNTALHVAALINEPERVIDLLNAGASPLARNAQGVTFQRYLFMTRLELLNAETSHSWETVLDWLHAHRIPLDMQST